jgi:PAS domain S-box-containing protein
LADTDYAASVIDAVDDALIGNDRNGRITTWNRAAERLLGYAARDVVGRQISLLFPPERQREEAAVLVRILNGEPVVPSCRRLVAKDGRPVELSVAMSPIRDAAGLAIGALRVCRPPIHDANGHIIGASTIARDIGDEKRAAAAALHLAALVESSDDAIVSKSLDGIVQSWNLAAERLFGYTAAEMIGQSITKIVPTDRRAEEAYVLDQIRAGHSVEHFETVRLAKDGGVVDISLTVSPIRDGAGHIVGASKIARDIREHKRLLDERRIAAANEEAARREVLESQNRRMQEASRLKSEFVANMSHELRTPLNSIVGFAELIADARFGPLAERYREFARVMHTSAHHLLQLINDILDLAKVESGKIDFRPEQVDLADVVTETTKIVSGLAARRKLQLTVDVDPALGTVHLDPMRLKQVLYNYLSNAIKFTAERGRVTVRLRAEEGDRFRLEVEDTGIGIKPEEEHRLFIEFQQLDAGTAKKYGGSGLGLALTKRLVEAQGGTVGVRSVFGSGSTFFATLPRHVNVQTADMTRPVAVRAH